MRYLLMISTLLLLVSCNPITPTVSPIATPTLDELPIITDTMYIPYVVYMDSAMPKVFDVYGDEQTWDWLIENFGAITWEGEGLIEIHACTGNCPATHVIKVVDINNQPIEGQVVVWSWPGAPELPEELRNCGINVGIWEVTNGEGLVGFAMGPGAYYLPPSGGPHTSWLPGMGCLGGIGMISLTNHAHIDAIWQVEE